jgi:hypothetical protein
MHTCLSLSNVGGHWYVEDAVSGLISGLSACCDSIEWCNLAVEGPGGAGETRCWRLELKLRIFNEIVRASARLPAGVDPSQSLSEALADIYASATTQIDQIAKQHQGCCCHHAGQLATAPKVCA